MSEMRGWPVAELAQPGGLDEDPGVYGDAGVRRPPAPGEESAGPALTQLVQEMAMARAALQSLYGQARVTARERLQTGISSGQLDSNGDAAVHLFSVPQGATGYLMFAALEEAGATPAAPDTSATLWHAIYEAPGAGMDTQAQVVAQGALRDFLLNAPTRGDAMIPDVYKYADRYGAPSAVGPNSFYLVVDAAANVSRKLSVAWQVLVVTPEP